MSDDQLGRKISMEQSINESSHGARGKSIPNSRNRPLSEYNHIDEEEEDYIDNFEEDESVLSEDIVYTGERSKKKYTRPAEVIVVTPNGTHFSSICLLTICRQKGVPKSSYRYMGRILHQVSVIRKNYVRDNGFLIKGIKIMSFPVEYFTSHNIETPSHTSGVFMTNIFKWDLEGENNHPFNTSFPLFSLIHNTFLLSQSPYQWTIQTRHARGLPRIRFVSSTSKGIQIMMHASNMSKYKGIQISIMISTTNYHP
jgi:hypothetical protein